MKVVNWLDLHLQELEIEDLRNHAAETTTVQELCKILVITILNQNPWNDRDDLIDLYHPSATYHQGEWLALAQYGSKEQGLTSWQINKIKSVQTVQNPVQGTFQVVEFESNHLTARACNIPDAKFSVPDYSSIRDADIWKLTTAIVNEYYDHLVMAIARLISERKLNGKIVGQNYIPYRLDNTVSETLPKMLNSLTINHPWISETELKSSIIAANTGDDISITELNDLIKTALNKPQYTYLGNGYWTTTELYKKILREIPRGVPAPHIHSVINIWTENDYQDVSSTQPGTYPEELKYLEDEDGEIEQIGSTVTWLAPDKPVKLPTLTYLHITQAYFPVGKVIHAFPPDAKLIRLKIVDGDYQDFLLNRDDGHLVAVNEELFFNTFRDGPPAGSYLWLSYEGNERYKVAPRLLEEPRIIPCKLVYLDQGRLVVENSKLSMKYDGNPSVFKADLRFLDLKAFFREARRSNLSVRDAIIQSIKELADQDPDRRAHITDIFNLVFLKRMCSPQFVNLLLYTQPCFKSLGHGYFQYMPMPGHPDFQPPEGRLESRHSEKEASKILHKIETPQKSRESSIPKKDRVITGKTEPMPVIPQKGASEITKSHSQDNNVDQSSRIEGETEQELAPPLSPSVGSAKEPIVQIAEPVDQNPELEATRIPDTPKELEIPKVKVAKNPALAVRVWRRFVVFWRGLLRYLKGDVK